MKKQDMAEELYNTRLQINELKRREKLLREFFLTDMDKYQKKSKHYGPYHVLLLNSERERVNTDLLHLHYPDLYEKLMATYEVTTLKCQKKEAQS